MANNTDTIIIQAARRVFITHGYKRANMSLISKEAGFSRVTIHKHLNNKDDAFRKSIEYILAESRIACGPIMEQARLDLPCWQAIESLLKFWITPTFEEVADHLILQELKYYAQEIAQGLFNDAHADLEHMLEQVLIMAINAQTINLKPLNLDAAKLAGLIVASASGLRTRFGEDDMQKTTQQFIKVFQQATVI